MNDITEARITEEADYIIETGSTVRATAVVFGVSKSTVHKDVTERLSKIKPALHEGVVKVLDFNKSDRHIRGGEATKRKYQLINEMEDVNHGRNGKKKD